MAVEIAGRADLGALVALVGETLEMAWSANAVAAELAFKGGRVWVYRDAEQPTSPMGGFLMVRSLESELEVTALGVHPDWRRRGWAAALLDGAVVWARGRGVERIHLEVGEANRPARALYEHFGFVVVGRRSRYYPDGGDALLMTCRLAADRSMGPGEPIGDN